MHVKGLVAVAVLATFTAGCATSQIKRTAQYDERINFANYDTFFLLAGHSSGNPVTDDRLASDVKSTLMSKGWVAVPPGDGEAAVVVHVATSAAHSDESFYTGWGDWQWRATGFTGPGNAGQDYKPGTIVVTIFDAESKRAIWRGSATDAISNNPKHAAMTRETAVAKLFSRFPPAQ